MPTPSRWSRGRPRRSRTARARVGDALGASRAAPAATRSRSDSGARRSTRRGTTIGERLAVDARLEQAVDGVEEVVAVELRVEAEDAAAEQAVEQLGAPRADRERLGVGPRDVPERDDRRVGQALADHPRQQREVVVLHQHDRIRRLRLRRRRRRRTCALTRAVVLAVARCGTSGRTCAMWHSGHRPSLAKPA